MAAKTFTVSAAGATAGQALDAASTSLYVSGTAGGGTIQLEASHQNSGYVPLTFEDAVESNATYSMSVPSGWFVRVNLLNPASTPSLSVVVI